ncbi:MAG: hypothetical protein WBN94_03960 [Methanothrix sp.]
MKPRREAEMQIGGMYAHRNPIEQKLQGLQYARGPGSARLRRLRSRWLVSLAGLELQRRQGCGLGGGVLAGIRASGDGLAAC